MPVPIIVALIAAGKAMLVVVCIIFGIIISISIAIAIDDLIEKFKGKRLCVLGVPSVGKTILFDFLKTGVLHTTYKATTHKLKIKGKEIKLEMLKLRDTYDVGGEKKNYKNWEQVFCQSDYIIYLFRADLVFPMTLQDVVEHFSPNKQDNKETLRLFWEKFNDFLKITHSDVMIPSMNGNVAYNEELSKLYKDYREFFIRRMREDVQMIKHWQDSSQTCKPIVYLGTHSDFIPGFNYVAIEKQGKGKGKLYNDFRDELLDKIPELGAEDLSNLIVGTFRKKEEIEYYTTRTFKLLLGE